MEGREGKGREGGEGGSEGDGRQGERVRKEELNPQPASGSQLGAPSLWRELLFGGGVGSYGSQSAFFPVLGKVRPSATHAGGSLLQNLLGSMSNGLQYLMSSNQERHPFPIRTPSSALPPFSLPSSIFQPPFPIFKPHSRIFPPPSPL